MGGCVVSLMEVRNSTRLVENPEFAARRDYGVINERITDDEADRSGVYRCARLTDAQHAECSNWYDGPHLLQRLSSICTEHRDQRAMAYRTVEKVVKEPVKDEKGNTREWEYTFLNEPTYITYAEVWNRLTALGRGLVELGLGKGSRVALFEDTRWEWLVTMLGAWTQGIVGVTVYANLGEDALLYALEEASCEALVCNGKSVGKLLSLMDKYGVHNATIIYLDALPSSVDVGSYRVISWTDVLTKGVQSTAPYTMPGNNDELLIMYTSGTTGNPKGVVHTIGALTQGALGLGERLTDLLGKKDAESYVAYLPAAHIFEFTCENIMLLRRALICFGTPRTLTDAFARPCGDLRAFNPFFFTGVPRIFETIKKTVEAKLPPVGTLKRRVFDHAYQSRLAALKEGKDTPYWNEKVFSAARAVLGNNLRIMLSGGGPLSAATHEFVNVVFGRVVIGYGLTETICVGAIQIPGDTETNVTGLMEPGQEIKLLDIDEYKHTDTPEPRGEMLSRGPYLFKGYYKQPELTREVLDEDGWFHTGDVGSFTKEGKMRIVGRVKALAKNCLGEYIALEALEAVYSGNELLQPNGVCVLVHPDKPYITALALTDEVRATNFAAKHGIEGTYPDLLKDQRFQQAAATSLADTARASKRAPFECVKRVRVIDDEWTPENEILTAAQKLKRRVIDVHYAQTIAELFTDD